MALDSVVRNAVSTINKVTKPLQPRVKLFSWVSESGFGDVTYSAVKSLTAIVNQRQHKRTLPDGQTVSVIAYVAFLEPVKPHGTAGRQEPIDPRDKIVLPDGQTGPIVDIQGVIDTKTKRPYFAEVWIGTGTRAGV